MNNTSRVKIFDEIKGLAILAVVVFHLGYFKWGYLGVDVFFAVAGYLTMKSTVKAYDGNNFSVISFIWKRIVRLFPLVLLSSAISLALGYFLMLPDDYENLAQSVIASSCFANNILCRISSCDYWALNNEYKPLLHFWYLGTLMQLYVWFALTALVSCGRKRVLYGLVSIAGLISAVLWFAKIGPQPVRFYYMPWRIWEFAIGSLLYGIIPTVSPRISLHIPWLDCLGRASFSTYVWHYVVLAFYRYSVGGADSWVFILSYAALLAAFSCLTYRYIEQSKAKWLTSAKGYLGIMLPILLVVNVLAFCIYRVSGVVRDIPELDISQAYIQKGLHNLYNDRIRSYNKPFPNNGRINVLIIGNSFARDWANVLLESDMSEKINIVYSSQDKSALNLENWLPKADIIFITGVWFDCLPDGLRIGKETINTKGPFNVWVVGDKWLGVSNGRFYAKRGRPGYYEQRQIVPESFWEHVKKEKSLYGAKYIDIMGTLSEDGDTIPIFSNERKFISQDCKHFTRGGARFVAGQINLKPIFDSIRSCK